MRKRFTKEETSSFAPGTAVEWRNVSVWHAGTVTHGVAVDVIGRPYVWVRNHVTTRTVHRGQAIRGYPGHVRLAG